jgi:hypothetical protein
VSSEIRAQCLLYHFGAPCGVFGSGTWAFSFQQMQRHHAAQAQRNLVSTVFVGTSPYSSPYSTFHTVFVSHTTPVVFHYSLKETTSYGTDFPLTYGAGTYLSGSPVISVPCSLCFHVCLSPVFERSVAISIISRRRRRSFPRSLSSSLFTRYPHPVLQLGCSTCVIRTLTRI